MTTATDKYAAEFTPHSYKCSLPEGTLEIWYRLAIGPGLETERRFESADQTVLEIRLVNASNHRLKHIYVSRIRITEVVDGGFRDVTDKLPSGDLFFEVVPADTYFGALEANETTVKHVSLITRGVKEGKYAVLADINYDIEQFTKHLEFDIKVGRD